MYLIDEHWQISRKKGEFGEISLRDDLSRWKKLYLIWINNTDVRQLYICLQVWLGTSQGITFSNAMFHGNFKMSDEVKQQLDLVFQLKDGWTVKRSSLKALTRGPLLNSDGTTILVHSKSWTIAFLLWLEGTPLLRFAVIISTIVGVVKLAISIS